MHAKRKPTISERLPALFVLTVLVLGLGTIIGRVLFTESSEAVVSVTVPKLSTVGALGKVAYDTACAQCHGVNGAGSQTGPPLVHDIYNPGHHADRSFYSAVKRGVRQHHWSFGNMPPQPQVTDSDISAIVGYIREMQEANGIFYRQHTM